MERRRHTRIPLHMTAELDLPHGAVMKLRSINFSLIGGLLENVPLGAEFIGCRTPLRLFLQEEGEGEKPEIPPCVIEFQAMIVRQDDNGIGIRLLGIDIERFSTFQKVLLQHAEKPRVILEEIRRNALLSADTVDVLLLKEQIGQLIIQGVHNIFSSMMTLQPVPEQTTLHPGPESHGGPLPEVAALIGFNGAIEGGLILSCALPVSLRLAGDLAGRELSVFAEDAADAMGELANMMAGEVQTGLSLAYEQINLTPPTIISGENFRLNHKQDLHRVSQYFRLPEGFFVVECFFS
ncbi:MAG: chemotaxis protein CheX [Magnetococcus sp. DMHC-1]|nr:chemotaxis protein CheX [Magnetococcales bacterium]